MKVHPSVDAAERDERLRKKLNAALFYPAIVFTAAVLISFYLFVGIVPQFVKLFASFGVELSPVMVLLLGLTSVVSNPLVILPLATAIVLGIVALGRTLQTVEGSLAFDALRMRVPIVGEAIRKSIISRLCRVLATLLQSGVNQVRALEVAIPVAESPIYASAIEVSRDRIASGISASLEEALATTKQFPPLVVGFIRIGGSAGTIPQMLVKIAEYYEEDVESLLSALPTVIQTSVTLGLGAVVAVIVYVVYVPLSTLSTSIR